MKFNTLATAAGILGVLFGFAFLFVSAPMLARYGVTTDPSGIIMTQFFGASLIQAGMVFLGIRTLSGPLVQKTALGACVGELAGLFVAVRVQLGGFVNAMGWSSVALYAVFAIGFGMVGLRKASA